MTGVSEPCAGCEVVRPTGWSGQRALGRVKLLVLSEAGAGQFRPICTSDLQPQEKIVHKAPEPLPLRLRHLTGPQPGVSRLGS